MKEKNQPKYISKEEQPNKKKLIVPILLICFLIVIVLGALLHFLNEGKTGDQDVFNKEKTEDTSLLTEMASDMFTFDVSTLEGITHKEIQADAMIAEVFSMPMEDSEKEIFRICYGAADKGELIGKIKVDEREIPVSVVVSTYTKEDFPDEETQKRYYSLMDQLNVVIEAIKSRENFISSADMPGKEESNQTAKLNYWNVNLPESIYWDEEKNAQGYHVTFYGEIGETSLRLYTISLENETVENVLGVYEVDGKQLLVSVKTYTEEVRTELEDPDFASQYAVMMETINVVLQAVKEDSRFSEQVN